MDRGTHIIVQHIKINKMEDLIKALQIFLKYRNEKWPTHCEHDIMMISKVHQDEVSEEDDLELEKLGFFWNDEYDCYASFKYGSA
jgi:uncharacterized protein CbrC (UPF0167 family)